MTCQTNVNKIAGVAAKAGLSRVNSKYLSTLVSTAPERQKPKQSASKVLQHMSLTDLRAALIRAHVQDQRIAETLVGLNEDDLRVALLRVYARQLRQAQRTASIASFEETTRRTYVIGTLIVNLQLWELLEVIVLQRLPKPRSTSGIGRTMVVWTTNLSVVIGGTRLLLREVQQEYIYRRWLADLKRFEQQVP